MTKKFLLKIASDDRNLLIPKLKYMEEFKQRKPNQGKKFYHSLFWEYYRLKEKIDLVNKFEAHHSFCYPYETQWNEVKVNTMSGFGLKKEKEINKAFNELIKKEYQSYYIWGTDGSKDEKLVRAAATNENGDINIKIKLPEMCSSYYAEVIAINKIIDVIEIEAYNKNLICSDSLSTLVQLKAPTLNVNTYSEIYEIKDKILKLGKENIIIELMYIPAHKGIKINEEADELAKSACSTGETYNNNKIYWNEMVHDLKEELMEKSNTYIKNERGQNEKLKGEIYFQSVDHFKNNNQWFNKTNWPRKLITLSNRIKSHHTLLHSHLFEKNIIMSPNCDCGEPFMDLEHVVWDCENSSLNRTKLAQDLYKHGITPGNNLRQFYLQNKISIMKSINEFLR